MGRKKRETLSAAGEVGGCLWFVSSDHSERHVLAKSIDDAIATYHAIPDVAAARTKDPGDTEVVKVERVDRCVYGLPVAFDADDDRSQG